MPEPSPDQVVRAALAGNAAALKALDTLLHQAAVQDHEATQLRAGAIERARPRPTWPVMRALANLDEALEVELVVIREVWAALPKRSDAHAVRLQGCADRIRLAMDRARETAGEVP